MAGKITTSMKDVATLAGVSIATVSNALNKPDIVAEPTRIRIQEAIEKLGWVRNESARQLRAGRSRCLALVVMDIGNPFFTDLTGGAEDAASAAGYAVLLANSAQQPDREERFLELFEEQRVRGILLAPISDISERVAALRRRGIPVVLVDRVGDVRNMCAVSVDDVAGGQLAVAHLLDAGHRRIGFVGGPAALPQVRDRREGAERAMLLRDLDAGPMLRVFTTEWLDVASGRSVAEDMAALPRRQMPTAVFAANDLLAIGLLQGFVAHGLRVPEDVAIVGYDDIANAAAAAVPVSSVCQPRAELGRSATDLLLAEIAALDDDLPHRHEQIRFTPELVVRASSDLVRGAPGRAAARRAR